MTLPTGAASSALYATGVNCSAPNTGTAFQPKCTTDDAGNKKQYQYDTAGNLTKQSDTTTTTAATEFENAYGTCGVKAGQVCTTKVGNGNTTTYSYSAAGDHVRVRRPDNWNDFFGRLRPCSHQRRREPCTRRHIWPGHQHRFYIRVRIGKS